MAEPRLPGIGASSFQASADQFDGPQSEDVAEFVLANKNMILREFRVRNAAESGEGLNRVGKCVRAGNCR